MKLIIYFHSLISIYYQSGCILLVMSVTKHFVWRRCWQNLTRTSVCNNEGGETGNSPTTQWGMLKKVRKPLTKADTRYAVLVIYHYPFHIATVTTVLCCQCHWAAACIQPHLDGGWTLFRCCIGVLYCVVKEDTKLHNPKKILILNLK